MTSKKKLIIILSSLVIFAVAFLVLFFISNLENERVRLKDDAEIPEVAVFSDKNRYRSGEIINITVKNGLDEKILYHSEGGKFWNIEYFEKGAWKKFGYKENDGFQLAEGKIGDECNIKFYELTTPSELMPQNTFFAQWDQKICPFDNNIIQNIKSGKYRFSFNYGFKTLNLNYLNYGIMSPEVAYSDAFEIK